MKVKHNTFSVIFYLRKYKITAGGKMPIYARITVNGRRADISVKRVIEESNWNLSKGMAKGSKHEIVMLNNYLEKYRSKIVECYQELSLKQRRIYATEIKEIFLGLDKAHQTVLNIMEYHNKEEKDKLEWGTMKNYHTTQKYITAFLPAKYGVKDKGLSELNFKFIADLESYLRNLKNKTGKPLMSNNGIMKHLERFCKVISLGVKLEWIDKNPFQSYKLKYDKVERECLTRTELLNIEKKDFNVPRLQTIADLFVFSCYTGLAYIDIFNLTPSHIVEVSEGQFWIKSKRQKTNVPIVVPLLPKALAILEKYREHPKSQVDGKAFPVMSNQKLNSYLKEIADVCGITKPMTFHIARHTFATTVTLTNGVPIESISKMLGHTKLSTTQIYAKVIETKLGADMAQLSEKL